MTFAETFCSLCFQTMHKEDYSDREKWKRHNRAVDELRKLTMSLEPEVALLELRPLLDHEDSRVCIYAATACREADILPKKTVAVLRNVIVTEKDTTLKMSAAMLLKQFMED